MFCKLKTVVSLLRVIVTLLSLRPFGNFRYLATKFKSSNSTPSSNYVILVGLTVKN